MGSLTTSWHYHLLDPTENETLRLKLLQDIEVKSTFLGLRRVEWRQGALFTIGSALAIIASVCVLAPLVITFTAVYILAPLGILTAALSCLAFAVFHIMYHYDSEKHLAHYRNEVWERYYDLRESIELEKENQDLIPHLKQRASLFLDHVAKEHSWENMMLYGIPLPAIFKEIFLFQISHMKLNDALKLVEEIKTQTEKVKEKYRLKDDGKSYKFLFEYRIPPGSEWRCEGKISHNHWIEETLSLPIERIFEDYDIDLLLKADLIPLEYEDKKRLIKIRDAYRTAQSEFIQRTAEITQNYQERIAYHKRVYNKAILSLSQELEKHPAQQSLEQIRRTQIIQRKNLRQRQDNELKKPEQGLRGILALPNRDLPYWTHQQEALEKQIEGIKSQYTQLLGQSMHPYELSRKKPLEQLQMKQAEIKNLMLAEEMHYELNIGELKREYQSLIAPSQSKFAEKIAVLSKRYLHLREQMRMRKD